MKKGMIFILLILSMNTFAFEREGGGGTTISASFVSYGEFALNLLSYRVPDLDAAKINQVLLDVQVFDVENICYQDTSTGEVSCLDAQYNASNLIINFDRNKWKVKTCRERLVLASHEYLRALGVENASYRYSQLIFTGRITGDEYQDSGLFRETNRWCKDYSVQE